MPLRIAASIPLLTISLALAPSPASAKATQPPLTSACRLPAMTIGVDQASFKSAGLGPAAQEKLRSNFAHAFPAAFQAACLQRRIKPANFQGITRIELFDAEGDTDGHFLRDGMPKGTMSFEYYFSSANEPLRKPLANALECLARPTDSCFGD